MVHTAPATPGLEAAPEGQGLLAAAGPSRSCSWCFPVTGDEGGGPWDGKLAVSREGSGKNELKPRKMRPCWRMGGVGGEAKGGHGEMLGNGGRVEGGGAGRGPRTAWAHPWGRWCRVSVVPAAPASALRAIPVPSLPGWPSVPMPSVPGWPPALVQSPPVASAISPGAHHPAPTSMGPRWLLAGTWPPWDSSPGLLPLTLHSDPALCEDSQARLGFRRQMNPRKGQ